jgi:hypothetical protein
VKAVGFLLLAGLLFRVLCSFPSSRAPALQITEGAGFTPPAVLRVASCYPDVES